MQHSSAAPSATTTSKSHTPRCNPQRSLACHQDQPDSLLMSLVKCVCKQGKVSSHSQCLWFSPPLILSASRIWTCLPSFPTTPVSPVPPLLPSYLPHLASHITGLVLALSPLTLGPTCPCSALPFFLRYNYRPTGDLGDYSNVAHNSGHLGLPNLPLCCFPYPQTMYHI
jgi:hypothetical protein